MSDKIQRHHLERKAVLYVRQSSAFQVTHNVESQKLQYAMQVRLQQLGWRDVEVVDEDLGRSASGSVERSGFERMVAQVCLGQVGAVAAREVSRFARNSREWQQLVEMCRVVDTLLIDQETVYSPRLSNDRLLLGLKGSLNEYELELLRQRSLEARREKARRGELIVAAPVGYLKTADQRLEKDPDRRVQEALLLVFRKFLELGTARQTLMWFLEEEILLPVRTSCGELAWKRPKYASIYRILTNPTYGGAYAYGKSESTSQYHDGKPRKGTRRRPIHEWLALIPEAHEGYIGWEQHQQIQRLIADNNFGPSQAGAAKRGSALLAGILRCRRCGRKLTVHYTGHMHGFLRYGCVRGRLDQGQPKCISFGGIPVDAALSREIVAVVQPAAVEAALMASQQAAQGRDEVLAALERDLEAARYAARRAEKQYHAADPDNRLVTQELERRWNQALQQVQELEQRIAAHQARQCQAIVPDRDELQGLAADLEKVWNDPNSDARLKKRIVRTLIHEVIADVDVETSEIVLVVHWKGGVHTELRLPRRRRGCCRATSKDVVQAVRVLARICSDDVIAGFLNRNGLLTGRGNRWTRGRIVSLRSHHQIPCHDPDICRREGWLNLTAAAEALGIGAATLRRAVEHGEIVGEHPLPDGPWIFRREALQTDAAARVVDRARCRIRTPAEANPEQGNLDFPNT
jgi:DNA invertase Pin-like site-specific DNA recombinase